MYSLVIPVYRNQESIPVLLRRLGELYETMERHLEVVFVVDGSPDRSHELLREALPTCPFPSQLLCHSRNFGSFAAIRTGLAAAVGPWYAVMAADLQEPMDLIVAFFHTLREETAEVVVGSRADRDDPAFSKQSARLFWGMYRLLVQREIPAGGVDVFGCNRLVRDTLLRFEEANSSLVGQLFWVGFRRKVLPYRRLPREGGGPSGWTFRRKLRYMMDSIFSFTDLPIALMTAIGVGGILASLVIGIVVLVGWWLELIEVRGYTPIMLVLAFSTSTNLLSAGILGSYLWRTYENTKQRPLAITMLHESFPKETAP